MAEAWGEVGKEFGRNFGAAGDAQSFDEAAFFFEGVDAGGVAVLEKVPGGFRERYWGAVFEAEFGGEHLRETGAGDIFFVSAFAGKRAGVRRGGEVGVAGGAGEAAAVVHGGECVVNLVTLLTGLTG